MNSNLQSAGYDQDRDKEIKLRLQEIMNKYNIKQVEVARETGMYSSLSHYVRNPSLFSLALAPRKDQRPHGQDLRQHRKLPRELYVQQASHEHYAY